MMELRTYQLVLIPFVFFILSRLYRYSKVSNHPVNFPPGPKTLPFIGNLHQIPLVRPELKLSEFARQFGPITGLKAGGQPMLVLNTWQAVRDLIEQKGAIYSSRPHLPIFDIVIPGGLNPALNPYGDLWRKQRKVLVEFLGGDRTDKMKPVQDAESTQMIYDMMHSPLKFQDHVFRSFGATIMATVFGQRGKTFEPGGKIETFFRVEEEWAAAARSTSCPPVSSFPFLNNIPDWLTPWIGWKKRALEVKNVQQPLYMGLLNETKERLTHGKGVDCYIAQCLKSQHKEWYDDRYLAYIGGILLEGGAETSASATLVFILAMAAHPEILERVQEEVDQTCGLLKVPGEEHVDKLPYLRACMFEVLRWRPIVPLGIPHRTIAEDRHQTYTVPAGTDVLINVWNIHHDPASFDSPATFDPSRYLGKEAGSYFSPAEAEAKGRRATYVFGAGRRVCPGQRFAENTMMMHFAKLAWAFDITRTGELPIDTWTDWTDGLVAKPKNLNIKLTLRDDRRKRVIEEAWVEADKFLHQFED